jgi:hypothetical protein
MWLDYIDRNKLLRESLRQPQKNKFAQKTQIEGEQAKVASC